MHSPDMPAPDPLADPALRAPGLLERLHEAMFGQQRPLDCVQIEVTSVCTGSCLYCPHTTHRQSWRSRHMDAHVFAALWPLLRRSGRAHLQGWGEPLLHPRFFDFALLARKAGCQVSTTSCGLRMDAELAGRIVRSGMDLMAFSLVGTDEASNDARVNVPFARVCEAIRLLGAARRAAGASQGPEIHLAYLLLADRMDAVHRLPELMDRLDADMAVVSTLDYLALPEQSHLAFAPHETAKIARARALLEAAAAEAEARGRILHFALPDSEAPTPAGGCRENIVRSLYVDAEGVLSPCVYLNVPVARPERQQIFGHVCENDAWALWQDERFGEFRRALAENRPPAVCGTCPKRFER